jgi:hypothetical protein
VILGLAILIYFLASISIERMPFTLLPSWWMGMWPSRRVGVYTWFWLLNAAGAVIAAIPAAILLRWLIDRNCVRAAFIVGAITALLVSGSVIAKYSPGGRTSPAMTLELILVTSLAVPFLVWVIHALLSNKRVERS